MLPLRRRGQLERAHVRLKRNLCYVTRAAAAAVAPVGALGKPVHPILLSGGARGRARLTCAEFGATAPYLPSHVQEKLLSPHPRAGAARQRQAWPVEQTAPCASFLWSSSTQVRLWRDPRPGGCATAAARRTARRTVRVRCEAGAKARARGHLRVRRASEEARYEVC